MIMNLFLNLVLAHIVGDFVLQTGETCKDKREKHWHSWHHYSHAVLVFALSWLVSWDICFWWYALAIGLIHLGIDIWKSYHSDNAKWFIVDQLLHLAVLGVITLVWCSMAKWSMPLIRIKYVALAIAILVCWKPANILIKLVLKHYSVNLPEDKTGGFNAGALIGNLERWLILLFVILQRYDAIGLLIAAKSIIRFGDKETAKTEYVLAGTLMSIFIAVLAGLLVQGVE